MFVSISILYIPVFLLLSLAGCKADKKASAMMASEKELPERFLVVLGVAQDAGYPQIGCTKECCPSYWKGQEEKKHVTCLALVDRIANQYWLFEATPDITHQLHSVQSYLITKDDYSPGAKAVPAWTMPRLESFLLNNGPWSQLVALNNIQLQTLHADSTVSVNASLKVTPLKVPHRDEYSETVGFIIQSDKKKVLFIPDIDKWEKWEKDIIAEVGKVDMALLDGTFYKNGELPGRDMSEVPHPFVEESLQKFSALSSPEKSKIIFIHFNHTNPLLKKESAEKKNVKADGFDVAEQGMGIEL